MFVLGKSLGGGIVPFSAYGVVDEVAVRLAAPHAAFEVIGEPMDEIALGGTMWGYAVGAAAARAALEHVLTEEAYERTIALGERLADGLERSIQRRSALNRSAARNSRRIHDRGRRAARRGGSPRSRRPGIQRHTAGVHGEPWHLGLRVVGGDRAYRWHTPPMTSRLT
jgi:glutamate-1-semialdehyde 2,1-aminomutase